MGGYYKKLDTKNKLQYIVNMVFYSEDIAEKLKKFQIPKQIFMHVDNAFRALDATKDLSLLILKSSSILRIRSGLITDFV